MGSKRSKAGRPKGKTFGSRLTIFFTEEQLAYVQEVIARRGETQSVWIRTMVEDCKRRRFLVDK